MQKNTTNPTPTQPISQLFESKISGTDHFDLIYKPTGKAFFGFHHYNEKEDPQNAGFFIREEVGLAEAILPEEFKTKGFESLETAKAYCLSHFNSLLNLCHEARN